MPPLTFAPQYERHTTMADLGHCAKHYWWDREVAEGRLLAPAPSDALVLGALAHWALEELYTWGPERWTEQIVIPSITSTLNRRGRAEYSEEEIRRHLPGVLACVDQYIFRHQVERVSWRILAVNPAESSMKDWIIDGWFLAMPDLIIERVITAPGTVVVLDHKTGKYAYNHQQFAWDPQFLTQCLAAEQKYPGRQVAFKVDYLQKPGYRSSSWIFPDTPIVEFGDKQRQQAEKWLWNKRQELDWRTTSSNFDSDSAQCRTWHGLCEWHGKCFPTQEKTW